MRPSARWPRTCTSARRARARGRPGALGLLNAVQPLGLQRGAVRARARAPAARRAAPDAAARRRSRPAQDMRAVVNAENPGITFGEVGKMLGQKWAEADEKTKQARAGRRRGGARPRARAAPAGRHQGAVARLGSEALGPSPRRQLGGCRARCRAAAARARARRAGAGSLRARRARARARRARRARSQPHSPAQRPGASLARRGAPRSRAAPPRPRPAEVPGHARGGQGALREGDEDVRARALALQPIFGGFKCAQRARAPWLTHRPRRARARSYEATKK
jgi:hypothetical protein